eukprot:gene4896-6105_t
MSETPPPEIEQKFIEDSLGVVGGLFGEEIIHTVWVDANRSPTSAASTFNKRLVVVGRYKVISIKKGAFGKSVELEFHLYNISEITQETDEIINIRYQNTETNEQLGITIKCPVEKQQHLIRAIRTSYRKITCGFSDQNLFKLNLPESKILEYETPLVMTPANGFIDSYIAHSYFYKTVSTLDFVRYIEALVQNDTLELDFTQCAGIDPTSELAFNLFTAITSLRHNTYFKSINLSGLPHANIVSAVGMCLETNKSLTKLTLSNLRIEQSFQPIANGLNKNPDNVIQALDLSKNTISYPVMVTLCDCFSKYSHGLVSLNLSTCDLQPKTVSILFESFERNFGMSLTLKYLNLSNNKFADIGSQSLASWLSKIKGHHSLENLVLSNCALNFTIMGPPLRVVDIPKLDLSLNRIDRAASKILGSEVMDSVSALRELNLSGCQLYSESLEDIFVSFNRNRKISNFCINLSNNNLGAREATVLSKSISGCRYLQSLDISNNKLNCRSIMELLNSIKNIDRFNLTDLNIGNNYFTNGPDGDLLCTQISQLITNFPTIRSVNISGGKYPLGKSLTPLLETLVTNKSLKELDISDNALTDSMASFIAEMLRNNSTLIYINLDYNHFGVSGWASIAQPLLFDINRTLNHMIFSKTLASAYTSTMVTNFLHQSFGALSKDKRNHLIQLFLKMQDKLAENRFETSVLDSPNAYQSEYVLKSSQVIVPVPEVVTPLAIVPEHLSSLPPPPSPTPEPILSASSKGVNGTSAPGNSSAGISLDKSKKTHQKSDSRDSNSSVTSNNGVSSSNAVANQSSNHNVPVTTNIKSNNSAASLAKSTATTPSPIIATTTTTAAPPRPLPTQNSADWHPDEYSEFEPYESTSSSIHNYSSQSEGEEEQEEDDDEEDEENGLESENAVSEHETSSCDTNIVQHKPPKLKNHSKKPSNSGSTKSISPSTSTSSSPTAIKKKKKQPEQVVVEQKSTKLKKDKNETIVLQTKESPSKKKSQKKKYIPQEHHHENVDSNPFEEE